MYIEHRSSVESVPYCVSSIYFRLFYLDFKNINWEKFNQKSFFPDYRHAWTSKKQILYELNKLKKFKKIKLFGFLPEKNKIVELNKSHTIYLKAEKK